MRVHSFIEREGERKIVWKRGEVGNGCSCTKSELQFIDHNILVFFGVSSVRKELIDLFEDGWTREERNPYWERNPKEKEVKDSKKSYAV